MTDSKRKPAKSDPDAKKTGNSCGASLGCLIIVITVAVVIFYLFLKPYLEEHGYSLPDLQEKVLDLKDRAHETINRTRESYENNKEKLEDLKDRAGEKVEEIKDKTDESIEKVREFNDQPQKEINKTAPKLIEG
ncbi:MAG: YtxH domain-containing protein [Victivallales bacterium]|nr:YtxH domain-containing protein [Victivallales bacterium]